MASAARDSAAAAEAGLLVIEKAPQVWASAEYNLDPARRRPATLEPGTELFDTDDAATDGEIRDAEAAIDYFASEVLRLCPAVVALQKRVKAALAMYTSPSGILSAVNGLRHPDTSHQIPADTVIINRWRQAISALKMDAGSKLPG